MKGSDLLVAALENEGVERIFGVPGEENLDVVESLRRFATMAPLTKMARQIVSPATIPTTVREAFRLAQQERLGPGASRIAGGHCGRRGARFVEQRSSFS
jgi:acetolactate synthase-1/2/3 large subunit